MYVNERKEGSRLKKFPSEVKDILIHTWQLTGMSMSAPLFWLPKGSHASLVEYRPQKFNYLHVKLTGHTQDPCAEHDKTLVKDIKYFLMEKQCVVLY